VGDKRHDLNFVRWIRMVRNSLWRSCCAVARCRSQPIQFNHRIFGFPNGRFPWPKTKSVLARCLPSSEVDTAQQLREKKWQNPNQAASSAIKGLGIRSLDQARIIYPRTIR